MQFDSGQPGDRAADNVFDARLSGSRDRDRIAVASQSRGNPQNLYGRDRRLVEHLPSVEFPSFHDRGVCAFPAPVATRPSGVASKSTEAMPAVFVVESGGNCKVAGGSRPRHAHRDVASINRSTR